MPKYRDYCRQMMDKHETEFKAFAQAHAEYAKDKSSAQEEFNKTGKVVVDIIREWEGRLCGHSEKGNYAKYSSTLAEKFWAEIKAFFPLIDFVGVKVTKPALRPAVLQPQIEKPVVDPDVQEIDDFDGDDFTIKRLF